MKRTTLTLFLLFNIANYTYAQTDSQTIPQKEKLKYTSHEEKRKKLWKDFNKIRLEKFGGFQEIDLYAEDNSLTRICFICDKGLFVFYRNKSESYIEKIKHTKLIKYDKINRITYGEINNFGFFKLWYYETVELSVGAD